MISALAFYLFAAVAALSGLMVITARNPVHAVLFLILAFFNASGLMLLLGAEFLAMILVIVYVGAVAVLFLFVVMMLDIDFTQLRQGMRRYLGIGTAVGGVLFAELAFILFTWAEARPQQPGVLRLAARKFERMTNTEALGSVLYTDFALAFQLAGLILLVAMIGAIVLTHRSRPGVRRQSVPTQLARSRADSVTVKPVAPGTGI